MSETQEKTETLSPTIVDSESQKKKNQSETKEPKNRPPRIKLEGEELKVAVQRQVEFYFSKENLQSDWYLRSQMDSNMYVPIKTIADFRMLKSLTTDLELLISVMKSSNAVAVDETGTRVRPTIRSWRNTLLLKEIPSATNPEEVRALFNGIKGPEGKEVEIIDLASESEEDNWAATFENDEVAMVVLEALRNISFQDKPVQARIKTEFVQRNYFVPGAPTDNPYSYTYPGVYMVPYPTQGYQPYVNYDPQRPFRENTRGRGYGRGRRKDYSGRGGRGERGGKESNGAPSTRKRRGSQGNPNIQLGTADFPPLPSAAFEQSKTRYADGTLVDNPLSTNIDFIKYNKQDIVDIVSNMDTEKSSKPEDMPQIDKVIMDQPDTNVEVTKPYPKRVTAAEIVQMAPVSPKATTETIPKSTQQNSSPSKEKEKTSEKPRNSEKTKSSKSEKGQHNGNSKQVSKHDNSTNNAKASKT